MLQLGLEVGCGTGQPEGFQLGRVALGVLAQQDEVAGVGDEDKTVSFPVPADLGAFRGQPGVVTSGLDFHDTDLRRLPFPGLSSLHLLCCVKAQVRMPRPLVRQFADTEHLGPQRCPYRVQQVGQRRVIGAFVSATARGTDAPQVVEICLHREAELGSALRHGPPLVLEGGA